VDAQNAQPISAQEKSDCGEYDRAADQGALDPLGDQIRPRARRLGDL
jgi:hypothetical protein